MPQGVTCRLTLLWLVLLTAACRREGRGETVDAAPPSSSTLLEADEQPEDAGVQQKGAAQAAGERVDVPAGKLIAGSTPGDRGRDPALEPALLEVELGAYAVDRLPYPNDPAQKPLTNVSRERAQALCAERGGRLCHELEWERACKGPENTPYAGGRVWDASCARAPQTCASGFGVLAMGGALREWTASNVAPIENLVPKGSAAVRGAVANAADVDHRCAHRTALAPDTEAADLSFRCCYGDTKAPAVPSPEWTSPYRPARLPPERLAELLASQPRLAPLAKDIKYFREEQAVEHVKRRAEGREIDAGPTPRMTTAPLSWSPIPGEDIILATGRAGDDSFIVALHRLPGDRYRVGAALHMKGELGPVVLAYDQSVPNKLQWTTCWLCYGETGDIHYRAGDRILITQR